MSDDIEMMQDFRGLAEKYPRPMSMAPWVHGGFRFGDTNLAWDFYRAGRLATPPAVPSDAMRDYPPLPEAEDFMYQHEDTGITGFIDAQQIEWGFFKNNPRLQKVRGVYTEAHMRAYIDADRAALSQTMQPQAKKTKCQATQRSDGVWQCYRTEWECGRCERNEPAAGEQAGAGAHPEGDIPPVSGAERGLTRAERSMLEYLFSNMEGLSDKDWRDHSFRRATFDRLKSKLRNITLAAPGAAIAAREQEIIAAFLERTGQYVTNDASREAAITEAVQKALAAREPVMTMFRGGDPMFGKANIKVRWESGANNLPDGEHKLYASFTQPTTAQPGERKEGAA